MILTKHDFIYSYLSDKTDRAKVNKAYSYYTNIENGFPRGSTLGAFLFDI